MTILAKVYVVLAMIAGILGSILCIAFFGWLIAMGVGVLNSWWHEKATGKPFAGFTKAAQA